MKITISLSSMPSWAKTMQDVIASIVPVVAKKMAYDTADGTWVKDAVGKKKVLGKFKLDGYKTLQAVPGLWVISSKQEKGCGLSIDFREGMSQPGYCTILFYEE